MGYSGMIDKAGGIFLPAFDLKNARMFLWDFKKWGNTIYLE